MRTIVQGVTLIDILKASLLRIVLDHAGSMSTAWGAEMTLARFTWAKKPVVAHPDDVCEWQNTLSVPVILLLNHLPAAQRYRAPASMPAEGA